VSLVFAEKQGNEPDLKLARVAPMQNAFDHLELDNPFWRFSLRVYGVRQIAETCLLLQDTIGIDVNLLLFGAWAGWELGKSISNDEFVELEDQVAEWRTLVIEPVRKARRFLRTHKGSAIELDQFAKEMSKMELAAEQIEQAILFGQALNWRSERSGSVELACLNAGAYISLKSSGESNAKAAFLDSLGFALRNLAAERPD
jgi:uncharacterized protein (TIGR02444 family)